MIRKDEEVEWFSPGSADVVCEALGNEDVVYSFNATCIPGLSLSRPCL